MIVGIFGFVRVTTKLLTMHFLIGSGYQYGSVIILVNGIPSFHKRGRPQSYIIKIHVRLNTAFFMTILSFESYCLGCKLFCVIFVTVFTA